MAKVYWEWWENFKRARKPIVIVQPNTIDKDTFDRVTGLIKEHRIILASVQEVARMFEDAKSYHKSFNRHNSYGKAENKLAIYIIKRGMEAAVYKTLTEEMTKQSNAIVKEICTIIPDYKLAEVTALTEIQQALDEILEILQTPGKVGI